MIEGQKTAGSPFLRRNGQNSLAAAFSMDALPVIRSEHCKPTKLPTVSNFRGLSGGGVNYASGGLVGGLNSSRCVPYHN